MKYLLLMIILCLGCVVRVDAQRSSRGVEMTAGLDALHAQLELNTEVIEIRHCSREHLRFGLRLNFANKGKSAVILDKRSAVIAKYMVSRSLEDVTRKKYEIEVPRLVGLDSTTLDSDPDESQFVTLKPGEVYSLDETFNMYVRFDAGSGSLRVGRNILQIVVLTWYYPRASNIEWRNRWRDRGYLWTDSIASIGMPFTLERKPPLVDCR